MSKLYLKGINNPLTIKVSQAVNIGKMMDDETIPGSKKLEINGTRFTKDDVRYVVENDTDDLKAENSETKKQENDSYYTDVFSEYNKHIKSLCDRSVSEKINDIKVYEIVWYGFTLKPITVDFIEGVKKRQAIFYENNPNHPYASINILDLLPKETSLEYSVHEEMPRFISSKVNRIIGEAYTTARFMHKI